MAEKGSASRRRTRDKEKAAYLKKMGITRDSGRCPICYSIVNNKDTESHIRTHVFGG